MKFILKINGTESPKAAYIGWTPVKCTLTIENNTGLSPLPVTITTGHDDLSGRLSLYTNNATSSLPVEKIEHDFQANAELTFYIAGQYPHASVGKKDTHIKVESNNAQLPALTTKVMIRVRKNANELKPIEIEKFLSKFIELSKLPAKETYTSVSGTKNPKNILDEIVLMHTYDAQAEIHQRTSFHPWHRAFLSHLERELQELDSAITVPYWRFDKQAENVFTEDFIGKTVFDPQTTAPPLPTFNRQNPLHNYNTTWGPLSRGYRFKDPAKEKPYSEIYDQSVILKKIEVANPYREGVNVFSDLFKGWAYYEEGHSHNQAHNTFSGHVSDPGKDPVDPLFFMMHGNVDRLWALWQRKYDRFSPADTKTYPFQGKHPGHAGPPRLPRNQDKGNFLKDTLWPWDMDNAPIRPIRNWNIPGIGSGRVPQIKLKFPGSLITTAPGISPTVESMIDYQGRLNKAMILGFDYDKIPYFDHDPITFEDQMLADTEEQNLAFLNPELPIETRLAAATNARINKQDEVDTLLNIIENKNENEPIRIQAVRFADDTDEQFLDTGINIIQDNTAPTALRSELIHAVSMAKRSNLHFPSRQPAFFNVLRGLITSHIPLLRTQAIKILSANEDDTVQEFLVEELRKDQSDLISKKDAIAFLTQIPKPQHAALFTDVFEKSNDVEIKSAALRGLANDPSAADLLKNVVMNDQESFKVREAGAFSLHHIDPTTMNALATQLITKPAVDAPITFFARFAPDTDEANFKAGLLNMLTFTGDIKSLKQNASLRTSLEKAADPGMGRAMFKAMADDATAEATAPNIVEQMAAKLLMKFDENSEDE